jgi:hypothetical protein
LPITVFIFSFQYKYRINLSGSTVQTSDQLVKSKSLEYVNNYAFLCIVTLSRRNAGNLYPGILSISSLTWGHNQLSVNESISRQEYSAGWLCPHVRDDMLKIPGYKFPAFRRDRVGKMGGGLMVFVKDHMNCKHRPVALFTKIRN